MKRKTPFLLGLAVALACGLSHGAAFGEEALSERRQEEVEVALKCFRNLPEGLRLVLKEPTIRIWVERATIPGTSGGLTGADAHQVLIATGPKAAQLRSFSATGGNVTISQELYLLRYSTKAKMWEVVEGNGGIATYEAVSRYVNGLQRRVTGRTIHTEALSGKGQCKIK